MKKTGLMIIAALLPAMSFAQVTYSLPQTVVSLEVEALKESFHAGPYARFAKKYLGIDARTADYAECHVTAVRMVSYAEADQSRRFVYDNPKGSAEQIGALTAQGLVSLGGARSADARWRFASDSKGDFSERGVTSNLTEESATLYRKVSDRSVAVSQQMVVEKSLETRAREAAETIFKLRDKKMEIVTGDTDATFSGEALGAALSEIDRLEKEYMSMFIGYSDYAPQTMTYEVIPARDTRGQRYVAFRVSDTEGLLPADNVSGRPYLLELVPQEMDSSADVAKKAKEPVYYRIPAICTVRLTDGVNVLMQSRMPVYQLGIDATM